MAQVLSAECRVLRRSWLFTQHSALSTQHSGFQPPVLFEMPQRRRFVGAALVDAGQVVVRVGVLGIEVDGAQIRIAGLVQAPEVLEGYTQVERGRGVRRIGLERAAVVLLRGQR